MSLEGADNPDQQNADNPDQQNAIGEDDWRFSLPDEIKDSADLAKFTDVNALAQSYINASQLIGRDKIPMPQSDEEWKETYRRLGQPEELEGYELNIPESASEKLKTDLEKALPWFKQTAYSVGLNNKQANHFFTKYISLVTEQTESNNINISAEMAEAQVALETRHGDGLPAKMVLANRAIDRFGGEPLIKLFAENGLGRDPRVVEAFIKVGELIAEDVGLDKFGEPIESPENLDDKINDLMNRPAYLNSSDPAHEGAVKQVQALMKRRHPEPGQ